MSELFNTYASLERQFTELEKLKYINIAQSQALENEKRREILTQIDLKDLSDETVSYKSVGRLFLQRSVPDLRKDIVENVKYCEEELKKLAEQRNTVEKRLIETEKNIKEILPRLKEKAAQK